MGRITVYDGSYNCIRTVVKKSAEHPGKMGEKSTFQKKV